MKAAVKIALVLCVLCALAGLVFAQWRDFRDDKVGIDMVFVKGGTFMMGCTGEKGSECFKFTNNSGA